MGGKKSDGGGAATVLSKKDKKEQKDIIRRNQEMLDRRKKERGDTEEKPTRQVVGTRPAGYEQYAVGPVRRTRQSTGADQYMAGGRRTQATAVDSFGMRRQGSTVVPAGPRTETVDERVGNQKSIKKQGERRAEKRNKELLNRRKAAKKKVVG